MLATANIPISTSGIRFRQFSPTTILPDHDLGAHDDEKAGKEETVDAPVRQQRGKKDGNRS